MERQVFECLSLGLAVFDTQLRLIYHNPAAQWLVAGRPNVVEALQHIAIDSRYEDWQGTLRAVLTTRQPARFEQVVFRFDHNSEQLFNLTCLPLIDADGQVTGGILVMEDVTAQAGLEQRLAVSERMAAVGKLAARVAHELNNPLDGILRYLNLGIRAVQVNQTERLADYLQQARGGLLRMTQIVRELLEFSRNSHTTFDDTSINAAVDEAVKVMSDKAVAAGVSIACRFEEKLPATRGTSLFQVFCNLIKNAIDAMPQGGTLTITTEAVDHQTVIRFEDTGVGLPEQMERLFEPFFTTKGPGKGTGLGLAICKDIVEKHHGTITPSRRPEGGAAFTIRIPQRPAASRDRQGAESPTNREPAPQEHRSLTDE